MLTPRYSSNAHVTIGGIEEGEEVEEVNSVLRTDWHGKHSPFTFGMLSGPVGTGLENGWILPSSSFPEQPDDWYRLKCFEWVGSRWLLPS